MKNTACRPKIIVSADGSGIVSQVGRCCSPSAADRGPGTAAVRGTGPVAGTAGCPLPGEDGGGPGGRAGARRDCLADVAMLRGRARTVRSGGLRPVISRLVSQLARHTPRALTAIRSARAAARERAWAVGYAPVILN